MLATTSTSKPPIDQYIDVDNKPLRIIMFNLSILTITWFTSEWPTQASGPLNPGAAPAQQQRVMSQQYNAPKAYTEADIQLTISDI
jgi:hypothetical protein